MPTLSTAQLRSIFSFSSNIDWISATDIVVDEEDVEDEEGVLLTCANMSASSCLE